MADFWIKAGEDTRAPRAARKNCHTRKNLAAYRRSMAGHGFKHKDYAAPVGHKCL